MYTMLKYERPDTIEAAYALFSKSKKSAILGGTTFLRLGNRPIPLGIDLSGLGLDHILADEAGGLHMGAMCSLRSLETDSLLIGYAGGVLPRALRHIVGVQFRNVATLGASVFSKYGFSDILPVLLVCNAQVRLYAGGLIPLETFLEQPYQRDILIEVYLPPQGGQTMGEFACVRNSHSDFAILNGALLLSPEECRIAFGARPATAKLAPKAGDFICDKRASLSLAELAKGAGRLAQDELVFGSNARGSADYRRHLCGVLTKKLLYAALAGNAGGESQ